MRTKKPVIAICYDFDGTLAPGNMQEYGFFSGLGNQAKTFWNESNELARKENADPILTYMLYMIKKAADAQIGTTKDDFTRYGKAVKFFNGVKNWFSRIKKYGDKHSIVIEHYIVSSGLREMIQGTAIGKEFKKIYACFYMYDNNKVATWPAVAVNYTTKTQFLFRINKGITDDSDNKKINKFIPEGKRRIPFSRMIYIGDGETDVPCMKLVKDKGGYSIAVYDPSNPTKKQESEKLLKDDRVNYASAADYVKGSRIDKLVHAIIDKIVAEAKIISLTEDVEKEQNQEAMDTASVPIIPEIPVN